MRAGRTIVGWLALAVGFAGCRHPLASPYPIQPDPLDLGALVTGGAPDQTAVRRAASVPEHPFQTVFAYLGLLVATGVAVGAARRPARAPAPLPAAPDIARQLNHDVKN